MNEKISKIGSAITKFLFDMYSFEYIQSVFSGKLVQRFFDAHILSRLFLTSIFPVKCFGC